MKSLGSLAAHYAQDTTTLATCWKVTRQDGQVFGFTSFSADLVIGGVTYKAATGQVPSNIQTTAALNVDNLEVLSVLNAATITEADLIAGLWDYAVIQMFEVDWANVGLGTNPLRDGTLGEVKISRQSFSAELRGMAQPIQQEICDLMKPVCTHDLGDSKCKVNLASYTVTGTITGVTDQADFSDSSRGENSGWFDNGKITWTSGANAGLSMEVKTFTHGGAFVLQEPMAFAVAVGDAYSVYPGCNKSLRGQFNFPGTVTSVGGTNNIVYDTNRAEPAGTFDNGTVAWITGLNANTYSAVGTYSPGVFTVAAPAHTIQPGDGYVLTPPSSQTYTGDCKVKFNNVVNFGGYADLPGLDQMVSGAQ